MANRFCTQCGQPLAPQHRFCANCGTAVEPVTMPVTPVASVPTTAIPTIPQPVIEYSPTPPPVVSEPVEIPTPPTQWTGEVPPQYTEAGEMPAKVHVASAPTPPVAPSVVYCHICGRPMHPQATVCVYCGTAVPPVAVSRKKRLTAGLFGLLLGSFGVHNFYLGYNGKAITQLLIMLLGWWTVIGPLGVFVWSLTEGILILTGGIDKDAAGAKLAE